MKKVMLVLVMSVFTFGSSSFNSTNNKKVSEDEVQYDPCQYYAAGHWQEAINQGLTNEEAAQVFANHYHFCVHVLMPR
jgi:hypothetical protein